MKILKHLLVLFLIISIPVWLWIKYDNMDFLRYGTLHIDKIPKSLNLLDYNSYGASDFYAEYYFAISPSDFDKILSGRKYTLQQSNNREVTSLAVNPKHDNFDIAYCYSSGTIGTGLVNLYTNKQKTLVYVVYNVN